ncbi:MAG: serine/threonine-protein kinase [Polyangiaceae bacterium]
MRPKEASRRAGFRSVECPGGRGVLARRGCDVASRIVCRALARASAFARFDRLQEGEVLDQRFEIGRRIGAGAMGIVHIARDRARRENVAVKVLRSASGVDVARFDREIDSLVALQHPCVVRYVAHGRSPDGDPFLAMEWLEGETLKERSERARLTVGEILEVGLALASALAGAHARGVVHRDVKPANVFLVGGSTQSVKLLDFGVARRREPGLALTEAGAAVGTPAFMSPEQARGDDAVASPSDVFSLGTVLFKLASGRLPFQGEALNILIQLATERAPPLGDHASDAPKQLCALVDEMMAPEAGARPAMAEVFRRLLEIRGVLFPNARALNVPNVEADDTVVLRRRQARAMARTVPAAPSPVTASVPVAAVNAPPVRRRRRGAWNIPILLGVVAILGGGITAIALLGGSAPESRRKDGSAQPRSTASVKAKGSVDAVSAPPATASAAPHGARDCPVAADFCEPQPFADPGALDPDELLAACVASARRFDPSARLLLMSARPVALGKMDARAALAHTQCEFVTDDGRTLTVRLEGGYFAASRGSPDPREPVPDRACGFSSALRQSAGTLGREPVGVNYGRCRSASAAPYVCYEVEAPLVRLIIDPDSCAVIATEQRETPRLPPEL